MLASIPRKEVTSCRGEREENGNAEKTQKILSVGAKRGSRGLTSLDHSPSLTWGSWKSCLGVLFSSLDREHLKGKSKIYVLYSHCLAYSRHLICVWRPATVVQFGKL